MNAWWQKIWTKLAWAPHHKEAVAEMLLAAVKHDAGAEVITLLETHFEGKKGLAEIQMSWKPNDPLIAQQHGLDESTEFDTDLLSVLYQNRCVNTLQAVAAKGWLDGDEWVWYGKTNALEDKNLFAAPLKNAAFAVLNGHLFWIQKEDALKRVWGPKAEESGAQWLCDQILFATIMWETGPGASAQLKQPNWCPPPTEQTIEAWVEKGWIQGKDLIEAQETLLGQHTNVRTKKGVKVTEVIPRELLAKHESLLLKLRTAQPQSEKRREYSPGDAL